MQIRISAKRSVCFTWWPQHNMQGIRHKGHACETCVTVCVCVCVCLWSCTSAVFAPGSFLKPSFDDIIYQTRLLLAQTAELRHIKSCVWIVFHPLVFICERMSSLSVFSWMLQATDCKLVTCPHVCVCMCVSLRNIPVNYVQGSLELLQ